MDPLATTQDMSDRTDGEITAATHPFLQTELAAASRTIRNAAGWHIGPQLADLMYRRIQRYPFQVYLPAMRITELQSVYVNGLSIDPTVVEFDENTGETNLYGRAIEVIYTAGFDPVPEDLAVLTLELAAGALGVSTGIRRETAGSVSVTYARDGGALQLADLARLAQYKLARIP